MTFWIRMIVTNVCARSDIYVFTSNVPVGLEVIGISFLSFNFEYNQDVQVNSLSRWIVSTIKLAYHDHADASLDVVRAHGIIIIINVFIKRLFTPVKANQSAITHTFVIHPQTGTTIYTYV